MLKKSSLALSVALAVTLVGCSGGSPDPNNPSTSVAAVSGAGAKGIVKQGVVIAYEIDEVGVKGKEIGRTTSNDEGQYTLNIDSSYTSGRAILLELTTPSDTTQMVCDALNGCAGTAYGSTMPLPADFTMQSIIAPVEANASVSGQVTPFTHMAAAATVEELKTGKSAKVAVSDGNSQISNMLGFNIQHVKPVDITKETTETGDAIKYSLWLAAFSDLIFKNGGDINGVLKAWADDFADGDFDGGTTVNLKALLAELKNQLNDTRNADLDSTARDSVDANQTKLDGLIGDDGKYDPEPLDENDIDLTDVERAKKMVSATRTWVNSFGDLKTPADALSSDVQSVTDALDGHTSSVLSTGIIVMYRAVQTIMEAKQDGVSIPSDFYIKDENENIIGQASLVFDSKKNEPVHFTVNSANVNGDVDVAFDVTLTQTLDELVKNANAGSSIDGSLTQASVKDSGVNATLDGMKFTVGFKKAFKPVITKNISVTGPVTLKVLSSGNVITTDAADIELTTLSTGLTERWTVPPISISSITLPNMQRNGGDGNALSGSLEINNSTLVEPFAFKRGEGAVWINKHISDDNALGFFNDDVATLYNANYAPEGLPWSADNSTAVYVGLGADAKTYAYSGEVTEAQQSLAETLFKSAYTADARIVDTAKWRVSYSSNDNPYGDPAGTNVVGLLKLDSRSSLMSLVDAKLKLSTNLVVTGLPTAFATIMFNTNLETADTTNSLVTLSYNDKSLDLLFRSLGNDSFNLVASDPYGVALHANYTKDSAGSHVTSGYVAVNGVQVGTISPSNGLTMIRYTDDSFETFE